MTPSAQPHILDLPDEILDAVLGAVRDWQPGYGDHVWLWDSFNRLNIRVGLDIAHASLRSSRTIRTRLVVLLDEGGCASLHEAERQQSLYAGQVDANSFLEMPTYRVDHIFQQNMSTTGVIQL